MIRIFIYNRTEGVCVKGNLTHLKENLCDSNLLLWVDFESPTTEEKEILKTHFNFHPVALDDTFHPLRYPRLVDYGDYIFLAVHGIRVGKVSHHEEEIEKKVKELSIKSGAEFRTTELDFFLGKQFVITYHLRTMTSIETVVNKIEQSVIFSKGVDFLAYAVLDELIDSYTPVLETFDKQIDIVEEKLFKPLPSTGLLSEIFRLKRSLMNLRRISQLQREVLDKLARSHLPVVQPNTAPYLRNLYDHLARVSDLAEFYRDILTSALDTFRTLSSNALAKASNKINDVMRVLTVFAVLMLPLTVVTGIYGMNFKFMPEIEWRYGYPMVLIIMLGIMGGLLYFFKRKKWL